MSGFDLNPLQDMTGLSRMNDLITMEGAVDAEEYIVGPGDRFDVSVGGPQPIITMISVSADGHLMLPEAGAVDVAGRLLGEARDRARTALQREFENVRVEVTLSQPRQFYVHISGAVPAPGRYVATPVARISTVLSLAYLDSTKTPLANRDRRPALRNIHLIHQDGSNERIDLLKYYSTGKTDHNPYLRDGDVISVPSYNPDYDAVFVSGEVPFPGTYDHRPDDTVYDLLVLATGEDPPSGFSQVRLLRTNDDGQTTAEIYDVKSLDRSIKLEPRDQVHALHDPTVRGSAAIEGRVYYPGTYSVVPGRTTLISLLDMAGGLRPDALARGATLQRATLPPPEPQTERRNQFEPMLPNFEMFRADSLAMLQSTRL
ncbi:MAG: polysaccharide biosynthesis/export family protein, partial [Rhodothermales bacterium]